MFLHVMISMFDDCKDRKISLYGGKRECVMQAQGKGVGMSEISSWRDLLKQVISNAAERERIASEMGVHPITLLRWVKEDSRPRTHFLRMLPQTLPRQQQDLMIKLLENEGVNVSETLPDDAIEQTECALFRKVMEMRATTPEGLLFWSICHRVFQHALCTLDPGRIGLAIRVVICMPPTRDGKIHSLRESVGSGTPPWQPNLEYEAVFLGAESLAGYAVALSRQESVQDLRDDTSLSPFRRGEYEVSATAVPILYANRMAGCLLVSSTQPGYFTSDARLALVRDYAQLIAFAFKEEQFYPLEMIELRVLPDLKVQRRYLSTFRQRIVSLMREAFDASQSLTRAEAEQIVWRQIEEEMLISLPEMGKGEYDSSSSLL